MKIPIYQVDAFSKRPFSGNPAAICPLDTWLPDGLMQQIAAENNLAETAFIVEEAGGLRIRWFTPTVEVDLCGHATLAAGHVYFQHLNYPQKEIIFLSKSGPLIVSLAEGGAFTLDFPRDHIEKISNPPAEIESGLGVRATEVYKGRSDYMAVIDSQKIIENLKPDFKILSHLNGRGLIVTARGEEVDFVSRAFFPQSGIDEDPVTGSAHTTMTPFWAGILGKNKLKAIQLSARKGWLNCELAGERVLITGHAVTYMMGLAEIPD